MIYFFLMRSKWPSQQYACSCIAGYYYLHSNLNTNGTVRIECKMLSQVAASDTEAEYKGVFYSAQNTIIYRCFLKILGHKQTQTPLKADNRHSCSIC
mmetsp:Transcript_12686/g.18086  ORF Transcript_12686/g.18086 Transcript_12686/m.18086 type:complete len:97 (+) Transcript_12686:5399-5689(+)